MIESSKGTPLGLLLRELLKEKGLSMRKLGDLTRIDAATISRIINGKRRANLDHLEKFSYILDIPIADLLEASGYPTDNKTESISTYDESIQELLNASDLQNKNVSIPIVEKQLTDYKKHAQTAEGKHSILKDFSRKLEGVGGTGPLVDQMKDLFVRFTKQKESEQELAIIGGALLYFIVPIDVIPDYLFAVGFLDDAIALQLTTSVLNTKS